MGSVNSGRFRRPMVPAGLELSGIWNRASCMVGSKGSPAAANFLTPNCPKIFCRFLSVISMPRTSEASVVSPLAPGPVHSSL